MKTSFAMHDLRRAILSVLLFALFFLSGSAGAKGAATESKLITLRQPPESAVGREAWRNYINAMQAPVIREIKKLQNEGLVLRYKPFWLINAIRVEGSPAAFDALMRVPGVIGLDDEDHVRVERIKPPYPNDPSLRSLARQASSSSYTFQVWDTHVYEVWDQYNLHGEGMTVGMVDTGIDPSHPEFAGKIAGFKIFDQNGEDSGLPPEDNYPSILGEGAHGTSVAGLLVGGSLSGKAIGMAPEAKIMVTAFSVQSEVNAGRSYPSKDALFASYEWLTDPDGDPETDDGVRVISGSYGSLQTNVLIPFAKALYQNGVLIVNAMGNSGPDSETTVTPGNIPKYVVGVGAGIQSFEQGVLSMASYSSRGPVKWDSEEFRGSFVKPDVTAPSSGTYTTSYGGGYTSFGGTSAATPVVSGISLLLLQADPDLTPGEIIQILKDTANVDDMGSNYFEIPSNDFGYGFVNAYRAAATVIEPGTVSLQADIGSASTAYARIQGTGFIRRFSRNETLTFDYAPGDYYLEVGTDQKKIQVFPFTVTAGTTTYISGLVDIAASNDGLMYDKESAGLYPWHIYSDGKDEAVIDVALKSKISVFDGSDTAYRAVPAAGVQVKVNILSGDVSVSPPQTALDAGGKAQFVVVAGTTPGEAEMELVWIDSGSGDETLIEDYHLRLHPAWHAPPEIISVTIDPPYPTDVQTIQVAAEIKSSDGATLYPVIFYSSDGGGVWKSKNMAVDGDGLWYATLPAQDMGTEVNYCVAVSDSFGNYATESKGEVGGWPNPYVYLTNLTSIPEDDTGEPLFNQLPLELDWGWDDLLDDPIPSRRDIGGPMGVGHDADALYFRMRIPGAFEAADDLYSPHNGFAYGTTVWNEETLEWEAAATWIPGANAIEELAIPPLGMITPYSTFETDEGLAIDYGIDGLDLIFKVDKTNLASRMSDEKGVIFGFASIAINVARFFVIEMDVTRLHRYYPRTHSYSVGVGPRQTRLYRGWNFISASALEMNPSVAAIADNVVGIWALDENGNFMNGGSPTFNFSLPRQAVWVHSENEETVDFLASKAAQEDLQLVAGWNAFANPFELDLKWDDAITVTDPTGGSTKTLTQAASETPPWIGSEIYYYLVDGTNDEGYNPLTDGEALKPGHGYFIRAFRPLTLHLPSP